MQRRSLHFFIIFTLLASFLAGSVNFAAPMAVAAAVPPQHGGGGSDEQDKPAKGVAPQQATQAGAAAPNGQTAVAWGSNEYLQACNGDFNNDSDSGAFAPKPNIYLSGVTASSAGDEHGLYLLSDGTVYACGNDGQGAMGIGLATQFDYGTPQPVLGVCPPTSPSPSPLPSPLSSTPPPTPSHNATQCGTLQNIKAISAGDNHSLALDQAGNVYAWGNNGSGALGIGTSTGPEICDYDTTSYYDEVLQDWVEVFVDFDYCSTTPVQVPGLTDIVQVVASNYFSLALKADGTVYAWGYNDEGALGQGNTTGPETCTYIYNDQDIYTENCSTTPLQVAGLTGVVQLASGNNNNHVLALKGDGTVWAWGANYEGQLGNGTATTTDCECNPTPGQVHGPENSGFLTGVALPDPANPAFERIATGAYASYAVMTDGTVYAWGRNYRGSLGNGTYVGQPDVTGDDCDCYTYPIHVVGVDGVGNLSNITSVGSGGYDTGYAISAEKTLYSWGNNQRGQMGIGTGGGELSSLTVNAPDNRSARNTPMLVRNTSGNGPLQGVLAVSASEEEWVTAVLLASTGTFTVTASATGSGMVSPAGVTSYGGGSTAVYTATAENNQIFTGWTLDGVYVGYAATLDFTVAANRTLLATFAPRPNFGDVPMTDADYQAITFLAALGIINPSGVNGSGNFQPDTDVKRAEVAAFIARTFDWQKEFHRNNFPDQCDPANANCVDSELWNNVAALADYGVVGGYTDGATCQSAGTNAPCYLPRDTVKRVQAVSVVARAFIKQPDLRPTGFWDRLPADAAQFTNVASDGTQRSDLTTYQANAGNVPGQSGSATFANPDGNGSRRFVVAALYQAFSAVFSVDNVP